MAGVPRLTRIYTRTGDDGTTGLGFGGRVPKDHLRIECYGTVDELNSTLGVVRGVPVAAELDADLARIQNELFHLGSDLCVPEAEKERHPVPRIEERHVAALEVLIDRWNEELPALANFVLPGGTAAAAHLHVARTVCRRAERLLVALAREESVGAWTLPYLNRLSDALFVLARVANRLAGRPDVLWDSRA
ncbi:MAG: cob(I)yrinic acid a,c-diamide adenosyltransferase [Thermoanaerobaculia bacterium]|jgi:cob(I)alamin adenosyltransferase|nr:MAG: cob(I)yrinic acid a,c-diamide adenosyltransferase [Thermoanaerobaculia bacterium]MBZ0102959.1 cob(I)yrinic acid a,c-diamide adenosyltransferase [Thermoanaerobaculia bacterium]